MRVAVVFHNYLRGGAEVITEALCGGLRQRGCHIELFAPRVADNARPFALQAYDKINILSDAVNGFGAEASAALAREIAPMQPDVIWLIGDDYDGLAQLRTALPPGGRIVFSLHSMPFFQVKLKTRRPLKRLREKLFGSYSRRYFERTRQTLANVDSYVVLCQGYAQQLRAQFPDYADKIRVVYNPALPVREAQTPTDTIAYVGRLSAADKRVDNLLRIFAQVHADFPRWRLRIIGDGPDRPALQSLCSALGLNEAVDFCGHQSPPDLNGAQIICLTSDIEGWGMALIEGMEQGAVPVAFGCSAGVSEILADGRGVEIAPGDLTAYADALKQLIESPELRRSYVARSSEFINSLKLSNILDLWQQIL